ncbi:dihydroxy-acid dehydratase [Paenibacillus sp. FSL H7-0737]|uniref:dihydroxy-acid dehydratase domain-containing protein n=1 Tax=Paenibacillus sp. FSL H7-0737 TaxID=1536775 RepID=UPI0004F7119A|nr:dihydroxy-acid dehydratase [Paenibacillus sp. FSL H7-0737]AIQ23129.1 hypothetical protein H70737_09880 [Paenibacillus sp. FSL H7-0737]
MSQISHELYLSAAPEAAIGGIATLVQDGDEIELDISARSLELKVSGENEAKRRITRQAPKLHNDKS